MDTSIVDKVVETILEERRCRQQRDGIRHTVRICNIQLDKLEAALWIGEF